MPHLRDMGQNSSIQNLPGKSKRENAVPTVSRVFDDGKILEMACSPRERKSYFILWNDGEWSQIESFKAEQVCLVPYSAGNNLIKHEVVLFPSEPEEYGSEGSLIGEIQSFVHKYVDIDPVFEKIASHYVLFTWIYDNFNELPYLRLRGEPGTGKTRFLQTVGSLCYKPMFASGASTVSPIFRILDAFRGTLIMDESDFRMSDEKAETVKILNNGNVRGFPVLRSETSNGKEFEPRAYSVFGPKIVATRGFFEDRALESRFLTEEMGQNRMREDVPINMTPEYKDEALHIRNKLMLFRFRNLHKRNANLAFVNRSIEPRLNQIFVPLLSVMEDPGARQDVKELARSYDREMVSDRGMDTEAQILEIIQNLLASKKTSPSVKDITDSFLEKHGQEYERKITAKWIGNIIRKKLNLKTHKSHGVFIIPPEEHLKLKRLYERYGIDQDKTAEVPDDPPILPEVP